MRKLGTVRFGDIAVFRNGVNFAAAQRGGTVKLIGVADFWERSTPDFQSLPTIDAAAVPPDSLLRNGDLLFVRSNGNPDLVGRCLRLENVNEPVTHSGFTVRARLAHDSVRPEIVAMMFECGLARRELARRAGGTNISNLSQDTLSELPVPKFTPDVAQRIVALAMRLAACESLSRGRIVAKRRLKRALLQQLTSGAARNAKVSGVWKRTPLASLATELTTRNRCGFGAERVMGVLKHEGLVPMRERLMASNLSHYKVVPPRAFAYNPMRINIGSIAYSWHQQDVLVSPDYEVFATRPDQLDPRYLDHVRRTAAWSRFVSRAGNGSVRVRIYYHDLAQFVFPLPPLPEQRRIAGLLDSLDQEIVLLERQLAAYHRLKRGLMQGLLTGNLATSTKSAPHTL